ncbi:MAG: DNA polymerase IV [Syntrophorhabdaceae bacterium]
MENHIACVDMDAFFASVEQRDNPALQGKPIAVTGSGERTIITTSSYEARSFGVKTGMTPRQARKLCPDIIFVTANNRKYAEGCKKLEEICSRFTPDLEIYSIDEVFLDITRSHHLFGGPEHLARAIKMAVVDELRITCTVGIGPNILIAKLASDLAKPDGLLMVDEDTIPSILEELPVKKLWGIGPHTEKKLRAMGIMTCGALGRTSTTVLVRAFGSMGKHLKDMGQGKIVRPIESQSADPKSIGHSTTFPKDIDTGEEIARYLLYLSEKVGRRARRHDYKGRRITLTIRYSDFTTFTRQKTFDTYTNDTAEIYRCTRVILDTVHLTLPIRLLGISLSDFAENAKQMDLFQEKHGEKRAALSKAIDAVNDKYGDHTLIPASIITEDDSPGVISPAWRPSGPRNYED